MLNLLAKSQNPIWFHGRDKVKRESDCLYTKAKVCATENSLKSLFPLESLLCNTENSYYRLQWNYIILFSPLFMIVYISFALGKHKIPLYLLVACKNQEAILIGANWLILIITPKFSTSGKLFLAVQALRTIFKCRGQPKMLCLVCTRIAKEWHELSWKLFRLELYPDPQIFSFMWIALFWLLPKMPQNST